MSAAGPADGTIRDWFAAEALKGLFMAAALRERTLSTDEDHVRRSWEIADSMMAERERRS